MSGKKKKEKIKIKNHEVVIRITKSVSVVLVILILLFVAADRFGNITFSSVGDYFSSVISGAKQGDGYPYYFESSMPLNVEMINSDLIVLTGENTYVLDSTARKLSSIQHSYSSPLIDSCNGRAIMFDVGGYDYCVQSKSKRLYDLKSDQKILTASIGKDGTVAIATRGQSSQSELIVYNKNQKEVFRWACAKENIISTAVSDNGKYAAVSVVGSENGEVYTRVLMFDFDYSEPQYEFTYDQNVVSSVEFLSGKTIMVSGQNVLSFIKNKTEQIQIDLSLNTLSRIYTGNNNVTAAVFSKYGSSSSKLLTVYNKTGSELFTAEINSSVRSVSCDGSYISVLTDRQLITYSKSGKVVGETDVTSDGVKCFTDGIKTYILTTSCINEYKTINEVDEDETGFTSYSNQ